MRNVRTEKNDNLSEKENKRMYMTKKHEPSQ